MDRERISNISLTLVSILSFTALVTVVTGFTQPPQPDEGTAAHIFQIAIVLLVPSLLIFLTTTDRSQPSRIAKRLALPSMALVVAFVALFYLEHSR
jgi:heme/copper-type cytochrome/quinol oxidase subunit 4